MSTIQIDAEQVVSNAKGVVTYVDEKGGLKKAAASTVEIVTKDVSTQTEPATAPSEEAQAPAPLETPKEETTPSEQPATSSPSAKKTPARKKSVPKPAAAKPAVASPKAGDDKVATAKPKTAAKKKAPAKTAGSGTRSIGGKAFDLSKYTKQKAPGGGTSYSNGDVVAQKLAGKTLDEVYAIASKTVKQEVKALQAKFKHLNPGMQRMNLGNMMRKILIPKSA